jgi:hypothetical protein
MESNPFKCEKILQLFGYDYYDRCRTRRDPYYRWEYLIHEKNIGIAVFDYDGDRLGHICNARYSIVDEKKWLLSKLKYGF